MRGGSGNKNKEKLKTELFWIMIALLKQYLTKPSFCEKDLLNFKGLFTVQILLFHQTKTNEGQMKLDLYIIGSKGGLVPKVPCVCLAELIKLNCSGTKFGLSIAYKFLTFVVSAWYREIYFF